MTLSEQDIVEMCPQCDRPASQCDAEATCDLALFRAQAERAECPTCGCDGHPNRHAVMTLSGKPYDLDFSVPDVTLTHEQRDRLLYASGNSISAALITAIKLTVREQNDAYRTELRSDLEANRASRYDGGDFT